MNAPALRLSIFYAAFFTVVGVHLPFWPVWLQAQGLGATEIGTLMALAIGLKVVVNPLVAHVADRTGERKRLMAVLTAIALLGFLLFWLARSFWSILIVSVIFSAAWSAIMPMGESLTVLASHARGLDYGRIRLWGSLSFIFVAVGAGWILEGKSADAILVISVIALASALVGILLMPDVRSPPAIESRFGTVELMRDKAFVLFVMAAAAVQASHAVYYAFGTLHWRAAGYSETVIGALWAEGVIAEIVLFAFGNIAVHRIGAMRLVALGAAAGVIRWLMTAASDALPVLVLAQALHAFTFGAAHLGAIHFISRHVPPSLSASAQSLYSAVVMGLGISLAILVSGPLYGAFAGGAYAWMAVLSGLGAVLAWPLAHREATARS